MIPGRATRFLFGGLRDDLFSAGMVTSRPVLSCIVDLSLCEHHATQRLSCVAALSTSAEVRLSLGLTRVLSYAIQSCLLYTSDAADE